MARMSGRCRTNYGKFKRSLIALGHESKHWRRRCSASVTKAGQAVEYSSLREEAGHPMQDRYVGDVGDFAKYGLLRRLTGRAGERKVRLGVVWCLFPDEAHNNDGRHISY